jgi:hypothetical protein
LRDLIAGHLCETYQLGTRQARARRLRRIEDGSAGVENDDIVLDRFQQCGDTLIQPGLIRTWIPGNDAVEPLERFGDDVGDEIRFEFGPPIKLVESFRTRTC